MSNLSIVERKALGAIMIICSRKVGQYTTTTTGKIAEHMGYKTQGGIISSALRMLEMKNLISVKLTENKRVLQIMVLQ